MLVTRNLGHDTGPFVAVKNQYVFQKQAKPHQQTQHDQPPGPLLGQRLWGDVLFAFWEEFSAFFTIFTK
jgi:hypothetical protein